MSPQKIYVLHLTLMRLSDQVHWESSMVFSILFGPRWGETVRHRLLYTRRHWWLPLLHFLVNIQPSNQNSPDTVFPFIASSSSR
jgi:hypothetical protein